MKKITVKLNRKNGFTIVELLVAMAIFIAAVSIASAGFARALRSQKAVVALMAANDNASLSIEQMAREIRTGYNFCAGGLSCSASELTFVNANNYVVTYRWNAADAAIERGLENANFQKFTADNVRVVNLRFAVSGNQTGDGAPPRVTVIMGVGAKSQGVENVVVNVQTTVSARLLDT